MMRRIITCAFAALLVPAAANAADVGMNGTTLFRVEHRSVPGFPGRTLMPLTQYIGADASDMGDGNLSAHLYGWGRIDLAERETDGGRTENSLSYGYLRYRLPNAGGDIRTGRFFLTDWGSVAQMDGIAMKSDLTRDGLSLSLCLGRPTPVAGNNTGDYLAGGRVGMRVGGVLDGGLSLLREGGVMNGTPSNHKGYRQVIGGDLWALPAPRVEVNGRAMYDTATGGFTEHLYAVGYRPGEQVSLLVDYRHVPLAGFFAAGNLRRTPFAVDTAGSISVYGARATVAAFSPVEIVADYRHYTRDARRASDRLGVEMRLPGDSRLSGLSIHRVAAGRSTAGEEANFSSYYEVRAFSMFRREKIEGSCDAIALMYDTGMYDTHQSYELKVSAGYRVSPELKVSSDLSYSDTPFITGELKWLVRLNFGYDILSSKGAGN